MMTQMCVEATTRAAFDFEINCTVLEDACAAKELKLFDEKIKAEYVHKSALASLNGVFAKVTTVDEFLKEC